MMSVLTSDAASVQGGWPFEEEVQLLRALEELKREGKTRRWKMWIITF